MANAHKTMSSPFHFVESQEDDETMRQKALASLPERPPMQGPSPLVAKTRRFAALSPIPNAAAAAQKSPQSPRRVVKTTPKVRLRHDDSQIQFAAIESSPLALEPVESQFLTDRQKEVKERQGRDVAAMFPEIRSSPRSSSRPPEYSLPKLVFSTNQNEPSKSVAGDESSPVFPPDVLMNDFLGSSPTPSSSKKGSNNDRSDDGPPSSPPFVSSHLNVFQKVDPPVNQDDGSEVPVEGTDHRSTGVEEEPSPTTNGVANSEDGEKSAKATRKLADYQEQASVPEASPVRSDERILSDFDVYVDAQSGPATIQQAVEQDDNEISHVTNSFQSQGSSRYDTEDDQVTAQLISEMERSSSQQSQKLQAITRAAVVKSSKPGRKRKSIFDFPPSANKKAKRTAASSSPQQIAEIPKAGEMFADCVMIDVRQAPSNHASSPVQIKGERVPSPSFITASRSAEDTPTTKRGRGRPRKKPRASQLSHVGSSVRESPRQSQIKVEQENVAMTPTSPAKNTRSSKTPRRSVTGVQQRKNDQGSQGNNSELDTDPLAPGADDIITETVMEGLTSSSIPQALPAHQHPMASDAQSQDDAPALANRHGQEPQLQANPVETRGLIPTPQGILQGFRDMLANIRRVTLGPEEERAIVGVLFESVKEVHEAGRRNTAT